jgi:two-component system sensor histidine kinase EvgS
MLTLRRTLLLLALLVASAPLWALEPVSVRLQWKHQFEFAGLYAAIEKGYYREAGLEVTLHEFGNGVDTVSEVVKGEMTFGIWNEGVLQAYMDGLPVVMLANYFKKSPRILLTRPDIRVPSDLRGKRLMGSGMSIKSTGFRQMLARFNLDVKDLTVVPPSFDIADFIEGRVDAYQAFLTNEPFQLKQQGVPFNVLDPSTYGTQFYDVNLFTSREFASQHPERVYAFTEATNRGWRYALDHPDEIIDLILQRYAGNTKTADALRYEYEVIKQVMQTDRYPIGSIDPQRIRLMGDLFAQEGLVRSVDNYDDFLFTTLMWDKRLQLNDAEIAFLLRHQSIRVHNELDWAPLNFFALGAPQGYFVDLMRLLAGKLNLEVKFVTGPHWSEFLGMLKDKQIDLMSNIVSTAERRRYALFTEPMMSLATTIVSRRDGPLASLDELSGKRVAVVKGFWQEELLAANYPDIQQVEVESTEEALKAVAYGKADATLGEAPVLEFMMGELSLSGLAISGEANLTGMPQLDLRLAVRDDWPELATALNKAYAALDFTELQELRKRWLIDRPGHTKGVATFTPAEQEYLERKGQISMCVDPDWMPFERIFDGKHQGIAADILRTAQERSGVKLRLVPTRTWPESIEFAKQRQCDIFSLAMKTPERSSYMDFTRPYLEFPFVIATRNKVFYIQDLNQVVDKTLALVKGYAFIELLRQRYPFIDIVETDNVLSGLKLVQEGRVFGFIGALPTVAHTLQSEGIVDVRINGRFDERWELALASRNDEPLLVSIMQKMIDTVTDKEKRDIYNSWYQINYVRDVDYDLIVRVLVGASLLLGIMFFWNRRLNAERKRTEKALQELHAVQAQLEQQAITDPLTQLNNRLWLDRVLEVEFTKNLRYAQGFCVILLDVDHFKQVNDTHGHQVGDVVLMAVADLLRQHCRAADVVGRWGGEEFLVICPSTPLQGAVRLAENLRQMMAETNFPGAGHRTASFGVSECHKGDRLHNLLQRADEALYRAKAGGRNRVEAERWSGP